MNVEIVREVSLNPTCDQVLVKREDGQHFMVSTTLTARWDTGRHETLAFPADEEGNVTSWTDVAGGFDKTREETIAQLAADELGSNFDEWIEEVGGPIAGITKTLGMLMGEFPTTIEDEDSVA